jgi:hypothetical protein
MDTVDAIKERWPLLAMCTLCGLNIPLKGKFRSPFREDRNPSCEVRGQRIKDWSTCQSFDAIDVFAMVNKISVAEAISRLNTAPVAKQREISTQKQDLTPPRLCYCENKAADLAKLRGLSLFGIQFAGISLGTLSFGRVANQDCWVLSDGRNRNVEARRMDGKIFQKCGYLNERKSHTLKGSKKGYLIGIAPPNVKRIPANLPFLLVEGGPDYLAACEIVSIKERQFLPVAMLGTGQICADVLPFFKGRSGKILAHPDEAGLDAGMRWKNQLKLAGAIPELIQLEGGDLNDLVSKYGVQAIEKDLSL